MYGWSERDEVGPDYLRRVAMLSYDILRVREPDGVWDRLSEAMVTLLEATAVRGFEPDRLDAPVVTAGSTRLPAAALELEAALMPLALETGRSLISNHPRLDPKLRSLADELAAEGTIIHALLLRADQETHGIVAAHWVGTERPGFERRAGFYIYGENAALAMAIAREREELRRDPLTGLPNQHALKAQLARHAYTHPLGVLVLDFNGMKAANTAFGGDYARGGDVLISAVADALRDFAGPDELPARMHTRGDEFCLLLPGSGEAATAQRCERLQQLLTELEVPETHRHVYRGASVGGASRLPGEPVADTLTRASEMMDARKTATRSR